MENMMHKRVHNMIKWFIDKHGARGVIIIVVWLTIIGIPFIVAGIRLAINASVKHPDIYQVERLAGLKFLSGTQLIRADYYDWKGEILKAKLLMQQRDVQPFIMSLNQAKLVDSKQYYKMGDSEPNWWNPDKVLHPSLWLIDRQKSEYGSDYLWILVDQNGTQHITVYLYMVKEYRKLSSGVGRKGDGA